MTFDSKREWQRYLELRTLERAGEIESLQRQVAFELAPAVVIQGRKRPALRYIADFVYREKGETWATVEDVKGKVTEGYRIKRHLMAVRGIQIKEVR
ncbi:FAA1, Long-chain acyl-CoA synthetase [Cupriavidus sp. IDO]|nr:FAA1, Long-chain acyl-CoA synthetase [Cupriavidus sp. IDO]